MIQTSMKEKNYLSKTVGNFLGNRFCCKTTNSLGIFPLGKYFLTSNKQKKRWEKIWEYGKSTFNLLASNVPRAINNI